MRRIIYEFSVKTVSIGLKQVILDMVEVVESPFDSINS